MRHKGAHFIAAFAAAALLMAGCGGGQEADLRAQARSALTAGDLDQARQLMQQAIDLDPTDPDQAPAYNDLGVIHQRLGEEEDAAVAFENSRRLDPLFPGPAYNLGILLHERGDDTRAATLFQEAAQADPTDPRPLEYAAAIEMAAEHWPEAEALLSEALARAPNSPRVHSSLGVARLRTRGASEAMTNLLEALELDAGHSAAYFNLAVIHQDWLGDSDGAVRYMNQFLEVSPGDDRATVALDFLDAVREPIPVTDPGMRLEDAATATNAIELPEPGAVESADVGPAGVEPSSNTVVDLPPETGVPEPFDPPVREPDIEDPPPEVVRADTPRPALPDPRPRTVDGLLALARQQAGRGDTALAYRTCREARALAEQRGDTAAAERILVTAVTACRDQAGAHYDYGLFLMNQDQPDAALRSFKQAVGLAPQWVPAYLGMAETAVRTGQPEAAHIALQRALRIDPANREATWGLAGLYDLSLNRPADAIAAYREFLARNDTDSRAQTARARIAALQRQLADSPGPTPSPPLVIRTTAREADPLTSADLRIARPRVRNHKAAVEAYNRGTIYQAREDWDQAIFFYTRALEQDDTFALAYYNLGKVYQTQNKNGLAIEAYEASVRLQPGHVNSRFNVALLYREQGRNDLAIGQLQGILQVDPNHARSHYLLGLIYSEDPRTHPQAITYFQRFLRISPHDRAAPAVRQWLAETR